MACIAPDCDRPPHAKGLCGMHYQRSKKGRLSPPSCSTCGGVVKRRRGSGPYPKYCSETCYPTCSVAGCDDRSHSNGFCANHAFRWRRYGDPEAAPLRTSNTGLLCDVNGCGEPRRKREWCSQHYNQWRRTGEVKPLKYRWASDRVCVVCGVETGDKPGFRKFCSSRCAGIWIAYGANAPRSVPCTACGTEIDLNIRAARRRRVDVKLCDGCASGRRKHGMSTVELAQRDGRDCGICGLTVDMDAEFPDLMRASVDHIIPRARGGANDPENLQLAHLLCNCRKRDSSTLQGRV